MPGKPLFTILLLAALTYGVYAWISSLPKTSILADPNVPVTAEMGETLFWGKATCHVCHRIGERGYALRGPNLGSCEIGPVISDRAKLRAKQTGLSAATAYLVQSIAEPGHFIVPGFSNEMPKVYQAPVLLYPSEIKAIIRYLQSLNGDSVFTEIELPPELLASYAEQQNASVFSVSGNADAGKKLFFDLHREAACSSCHVVADSKAEQSKLSAGPNLHAIADIRTPQYLYQKIVNPDSNRISGYQQVLIKTKNNRFQIGTINYEDDETITLLQNNKEEIQIKKQDIAASIPQNTSSMPGNYAALLSQQQIHDLVAFLLTLKSRINRRL